ncbi:hypothetical protein [Variovorax sp. dw_954]|uniref:hypothetical protein n=1 Tax=Variovorax sp. dw_954 TaxID=2720078 RepID=UPI001BD1F809|nr:hypothetical protein [Variovorax sp. dw_954]
MAIRLAIEYVRSDRESIGRQIQQNRGECTDLWSVHGEFQFRIKSDPPTNADLMFWRTLAPGRRVSVRTLWFCAQNDGTTEHRKQGRGRRTQ